MTSYRPSDVDRWWRATAHRVAARPGAVTRGLGALRSRAVSQVLAEVRPQTGALAAGLAAGEEGARAELAAAAESALAAMRAAVRREARRAGPGKATLAGLDRLWSRPDAREHMDDPGLDPGRRSRILAALDHFNAALGSYEIFVDLLRPLLRQGGPTRILDLASGHGGFALAAARVARAEGLALAITASDLRREYLDLGEAAARREELPVRFRVQDARDLSGLAAERFDVVTSTQSLHHLPPGLVAVTFEAAVRAAARGVVFVDGCRSLRTGFGLGLFNSLRYRHGAFVHDTWVSARRFYVPEELELLARIGPWGDGVEARWAAPGFCVLRLRRQRAA
jgi:SAM-dependent methyltransferase